MILSKTSMVIVNALFIAIFVFNPSYAKAQCQTSGGVTDLVVCATDSDCFPPTPAAKNADGSPKCSIGTVCNIKSGFCAPSLGWATIPGNTIVGGYSLTGGGLGLLINNVVLAIGAVTGLLFFAMLILGGIAYMTSGGDEKQLTHAKNQITAGLIGLLIVFMSWWVVKIISVVFGINLLKPSFTGP